MVYRLTLLGAIALAFAASLAGQSRLSRRGEPLWTPQWQCERIISMAPSITETLYRLGLGDRVVGVPKFSDFPPEAKQKPCIGNYYDPNYEAILTLKPDLVILLEEQEKSLQPLEKLHIHTLVVSHQTVEGMIDSFRAIGRVCGKGPEGRQMEQDFRNRLREIRERTEHLARPRVLMVLDRTYGCGHLADVYIAGDDHYHDRIIELAGGRNAYGERGIRNPVVSSEGIIRLNPDVIVEVVPREIVEQFGRRALLDDWRDLKEVSAVKNHRVEIFDDDYARMPGPRFIRLVEKLARTLHPELGLDEEEPATMKDEGG